jgi:hypothetical protein
MRILKLGAVAGLALALAACPDRDREDPALRDDAVAERPTDAPPGAETADLQEFAGSGVTGQVQVTPRNGQTEVVVMVKEARPNSSVAVSMHTGTCEAPGPRVEELGTVSTDQMGQGQMQTTVGLEPRQVMNGMHVVAVHEEGREAASPIACARIPEDRSAMGAQPGQTGR